MNIGDLVVCENSGKIGIVVGQEPRFVNYWNVAFYDSTYPVHSSNLKILE